MTSKPLTPDSPVQYVKTVGPVRAVALRRLGIETAGDLIRHLPRTHLDRTRVEPIAKLRAGQPATVLGEVLTSGERRTRQGGSIQTVTVADHSGVVYCVWFNQRYVLQQFRSGRKVMVSGLVQHHAGRPQLAHPDFEVLDDEGGRGSLHMGRLVPVYPLTAGIGQHWLRRLIHTTLAELVPQLEDPLPEALRRQRDLLTLGAALQGMHYPADQDELARARRRLVYQELLQIQLVMALRRGRQVERRGVQLQRPGDLTRRLVASLPFELTGAQRRALAEILADLRSGRAMHRLLQGDVGSGKTLVAFIAALFVIEQGYQALLMAPTEVLAHQHGQTLRRLAEPLGVVVETLTGSTPAAERRRILAAAGEGEVHLLVGTHAVIQDQIRLRRLALAVVDEQHRFGVRQRGRSARDGDDLPVHLLVMSATPIPRSLALTLYGDLDLTIIAEMPAGRLPAETRIVAVDREDETYAECRRLVAQGHQGFVVYPVVEETETTDTRAAVAEAAALAAGPFRSLRVGLVHGRLKAREKQAAMAAFRAGELDVMVATTVVEVGVDVPRAAWMVVHSPERFGLAQLHQLRGRIGRAGGRSWCWLLTSGHLAEETLSRLQFFAATTDGFRLAEEDLRLRGPGDLWGVRQHGAPGFRLANPLVDGDLAAAAAADVRELLAEDPDLSSQRWAPLRQVLRATFADVLPQATG
ncbi:MAG TPA: ATP-dependent DNA helicase RecG [Candidatus Krumholzibacteria bacterium]|nr:ATP-dependent DNA helicase RecG [Candidatus Krumholzibacteria bacterium]HPD72791.1 ATP-dependent DNA helicase RecG [Candidatus Krumholzibacteria bacterium]HRY40277.1 ATP-dependent DNA helicase RecG [Candidatus Krumholzibacteria bacterium]